MDRAREGQGLQSTRSNILDQAQAHNPSPERRARRRLSIKSPNAITDGWCPSAMSNEPIKARYDSRPTGRTNSIERVERSIGGRAHPIRNGVELLKENNMPSLRTPPSSHHVVRRGRSVPASGGQRKAEPSRLDSEFASERPPKDELSASFIASIGIGLSEKLANGFFKARAVSADRFPKNEKLR